MFKKSDANVREHSEEREWLLNLGQGNLIAGVQNLLQQMAEEQAESNYRKGKRNKFASWRNY